jgi:hypothetical protein
MLVSNLLSPNAELQGVAAGTGTIRAPEQSDAVALIQEALVAIEYSLPVAGIDDTFGNETGSAVSQFKASRGLSPTDPVVGVGTSNRLDFELTYLEGDVNDQHVADTGLLAHDPYLAGLVEIQNTNLDLTSALTDFFEFGDRMCFRMSFGLSAQAAALMGRIVEPMVQADYCSAAHQGPCNTHDFFDLNPGSTDYVDFLLREHPTVDPARIGALGSISRPDILRHRGAADSEWYEIKPMSVSGAIAARIKKHVIPPAYAALGLPYLPGNTYTPTEFIPFPFLFVTPEGENLRVVLHLMRRARGLVFWEICIEGDYVAYFNRVRIVAGLLALLIALAEAAAAAGVAAAIVAAIQDVATALGVTLPLVTVQ